MINFNYLNIDKNSIEGYDLFGKISPEQNFNDINECIDYLLKCNININVIKNVLLRPSVIGLYNAVKCKYYISRHFVYEFFRLYQKTDEMIDNVFKLYKNDLINVYPYSNIDLYESFSNDKYKNMLKELGLYFSQNFEKKYTSSDTSSYDYIKVDNIYIKKYYINYIEVNDIYQYINELYNCIYNMISVEHLNDNNTYYSSTRFIEVLLPFSDNNIDFYNKEHINLIKKGCCNKCLFP